MSTRGGGDGVALNYSERPATANNPTAIWVHVEKERRDVLFSLYYYDTPRPAALSRTGTLSRVGAADHARIARVSADGTEHASEQSGAERCLGRAGALRRVDNYVCSYTCAAAAAHGRDTCVHAVHALDAAINTNER